MTLTKNYSLHMFLGYCLGWWSKGNLQTYRTDLFIHAYEAMLCLPVFHHTGPPRQVDCLAPLPLFFCLFYLPYLSSIHEKANCIAILWTGSPHSLGSCLFRGLWATCLPHKGGGVPLSALPKDTTSKLAGLFSTTSPKCRAPSKEAADAIF